MSNSYALCVGINDYPGTGSDLSGCVNDAKDWGKLLSGKGFSVSYLLDKDATGKNMKDAIKGMISNAVSGDTVFFQYSGHGTYIPDTNGDEPDGTDECLCPHDIGSKGPLSDDELSEMFSKKKAGVNIVFISDSCHSGTVSRVAPPFSLGGSKPADTKISKIKFMPPAVFLSGKKLSILGVRSRRPVSPPGRHEALLLAGCQDTEYSYDAWFGGKPNGAFSYVALNVLSKLKDKSTYQQWFSEIRKALPSQQHPQSPNLYGLTSMKKRKIFT